MYWNGGLSTKSNRGSSLVGLSVVGDFAGLAFGGGIFGGGLGRCGGFIMFGGGGGCFGRTSKVRISGFVAMRIVPTYSCPSGSILMFSSRGTGCKSKSDGIGGGVGIGRAVKVQPRVACSHTVCLLSTKLHHAEG